MGSLLLLMTSPIFATFTRVSTSTSGKFLSTCTLKIPVTAFTFLNYHSSFIVYKSFGFTDFVLFFFFCFYFGQIFFSQRIGTNHIKCKFSK